MKIFNFKKLLKNQINNIDKYLKIYRILILNRISKILKISKNLKILKKILKRLFIK